jgi:uncharacterized phage-associated protein
VFPQFKQPVIARLPLLKRFVLIVLLETSGGKIRNRLETPLVYGGNVVMLRLMPSSHDVAAYILKKHGPMSTWKLQKLVYYSQAWSLVWDDAPLFDDRIEAWANGPVTRVLYAKHRGQFTVGDWSWGDPKQLTRQQRDTVDIVLADYGELTGRQLSHLTHAEQPWRDARDGLGPTDPGSREITLDALQAYYAALDVDENVPTVGDIDWASIETR